MSEARRISNAKDLLETLFANNQVSAGKKSELEQELPWKGGQKQVSLPIQILLIVGAWISAVMFLAFLGALGLLNSSHASLTLILGLVLTVGAIALFQVKEKGVEFRASHLFLEQFSVVCILAGKICIIISILSLLNWRSLSEPILPLMALFLAVSTYPFFGVPLERFLSMWGALSMCGWYCQNHLPLGVPIFTLILLLIISMISMKEEIDRQGRPLLLASIMVVGGICLWSQVQSYGSQSFAQLPYYTLSIIFVGVFLAAWIPLVRKYKEEKKALNFLCASFIALAFLGVPGLLFAVLLIFLGTYQRDLLLLIPGGILLPYSLCAYYYLMKVDLATKSYYLMGAGVFLLVVRKGFELWKAGGNEK